MKPNERALKKLIRSFADKVRSAFFAQYAAGTFIDKDIVSAAAIIRTAEIALDKIGSDFRKEYSTLKADGDLFRITGEVLKAYEDRGRDLHDLTQTVITRRDFDRVINGYLKVLEDLDRAKLYKQTEEDAREDLEADRALKKLGERIKDEYGKQKIIHNERCNQTVSGGGKDRTRTNKIERKDHEAGICQGREPGNSGRTESPAGRREGGNPSRDGSRKKGSGSLGQA